MVLATPPPGHGPPATPTPMKIGELARRSGLPVKTLRYYEDFGLLPARGRSEGGYRLFGSNTQLSQ